MKKSIIKILVFLVIFASVTLLGTLVSFGADVTNVGAMQNAGSYKLISDIEGNLTVAAGTYSIDLNGHTWTGYLKIQGFADVTITDTVRTGKITLSDNDVIMVEGGKLTASHITIEGNASGCDGVFAEAGEAIMNECTISAISSAVQNKGGKVTINGGLYTSTNNALKCNNDATITINGGEFEGDLFIDKGSVTNTTINKAFLPGPGYKLFISEKNDTGERVVKASVIKKDVPDPTAKPTDSTIEPTNSEEKPSTPTKQPNTNSGDGGVCMIGLAFVACAACVLVKFKREA